MWSARWVPATFPCWTATGGEPRSYDTAAPGPGSGRAGDGGEVTGRGAAGTWPFSPSSGALYGAQPISSSALPFVSVTNLTTNGMESAAETV